MKSQQAIAMDFVGAVFIVLLAGSGALFLAEIVEAAWYGQCETCPSGYNQRVGPYSSESQCRSIANAQLLGHRVRCWEEGGSSAPFSGGITGTDPNSVMLQGLQGALGSVFYNLGRSFGEALVGGQRGPGGSTYNAEAERQRQQEMERRRQAISEELARREIDIIRQRQAIDEELARQATYRRERERQAREASERERNEAYALLKGPKPPDFFGIPGAGDPAQLGIKDIKPSAEARDLSGKNAQWKRLHCSLYLSQKAQAAAQAGQDEEAKYLSEQAKEAMEGRPLGVACPDAPPPPKTYGQGVVASGPTPQMQLYTKLLESVKVDLEQLTATRKEMQEWSAKKEEAERKVQQRKDDLSGMERQPPAPGSSPQDPSIRAEAERLLREAQEDLAKATKGLDESARKEQEIAQGMKEKETLFRRVEKNPEEAESLLSQLGK